MKHILILLLAFYSCGFVVMTPESRAELIRASIRWRREVVSHYDTSSLHAFLKECIAKNPQIDGVQLSRIPVGAKFEKETTFRSVLGAGCLSQRTPRLTRLNFALSMSREDG